jgi:hypothetical protein
MKKIFTLLTMGALTLFSKNSFSQVNENFENGLGTLSANCWEFVSMMYATTPSPYIITGNASLYSEPPVSADSIRIMRTPLLNVGSTIDVSFNYRLSNNLTGQASRTITVDLTDVNGVVVQNLTVIDVASNATTTVTFSQTFSVNTPANYRLAISFSGGKGAGNVRMSLDDLYTSAVLVGCLLNSPLPVKLISFQGNRNGNSISLNWAVASNETADRFEVERSFDGKDFTTAGIVMSSDKAGAESYSFKETINNDKAYYRLKMFDKNQDPEYSKTLVLQTKTLNGNAIKIINNPVINKLTFSFTSPARQQMQVTVFDLAGRAQSRTQVSLYQGSNVISLPLAANFATGTYVVELSNGAERFTTKFVKQ